MIKQKLVENDNKLRNLLSNLLNNDGLHKTMTITGLNVFELFDKIEPFVINSNLSYDLIEHIFRTYDDELTKEVGNYTLELNFDGVMEWNYKNEKTKETMYALCTPYWDGDAMTPIDCEYYTNENSEINKDDDDEFYTSFKCPEEFNSIYGLMDWYENEYIPTVYNRLNFFLKVFRANKED